MKLLTLAAALAAAFLLPDRSHAETRQPVRGVVPVTVIGCTFQGFAAPNGEDMGIYRRQIDKAVGFWNDVADGHFRLDLRMQPWTAINKSWSLTRTEGSATSRNDEENRCLNAARVAGRAGPDTGIRVFLFHPGHDVYGRNGNVVYGTTRNGAARPGTDNLSLSHNGLSHELGHGLGLQHGAGNLVSPPPDMLVYDYGDNFGVMGRNGTDISPYARDRLGLYDRDRVLRFGWDLQRDRTVTLADPNGTAAGFHTVRVPFDNADPNHYLMIEWSGKTSNRARSAARAPQLYIYEVMKPGTVVDDWGTPDIGNAVRSVLLYNARTDNRLSNPAQSYARGPVTVTVVSQNDARGTARVRITNSRADWCKPGFVWREATGRSDKACVTGARRAAVRDENRRAASRTKSDGFCKPGFVWREATGRSDKACVPPASRSKARSENAAQTSVASPRLAWAGLGPNTCKPGLVWREANEADWTCVTPARRSAVRADNASRAARMTSAGRCRSGFVWREATLSDHVCVPPAERTLVRNENHAAQTNRAYTQ